MSLGAIWRLRFDPFKRFHNLSQSGVFTDLIDWRVTVVPLEIQKINPTYKRSFRGLCVSVFCLSRHTFLTKFQIQHQIQIQWQKTDPTKDEDPEGTKDKDLNPMTDCDPDPMKDKDQYPTKDKIQIQQKAKIWIQQKTKIWIQQRTRIWI